MTNTVSRLLYSAGLLLLAGCAQVETSCAPVGAVTPICGIQRPEDLEALPDDGGLLLGEYGDGGKREGYLSWYQPGPQAQLVRLVDSGNIMLGATQEQWGQSDCPVPDTLSPHGIHLSQRGATLQLLVVNHSSYEQVLMYEVLPAAGTDQPPALAWRGCVLFPEYAVLNDVAALPGGGFAVTHMYQRESEMMAQLKSVLGLNKGHVWLWYPGVLSQVLPNSEARMPNGIEVAADGNSIWVNNYIEQELRQYSVPDGEIMRRIEVPNIDNSAWLPDGRLLLASHLSPITLAPCFGITAGSCGAPYELIAVDTVSGAQEVLFRSERGGPFGPATVAVPYRGKLYAGSFSGDRLAEITLQ